MSSERAIEGKARSFSAYLSLFCFRALSRSLSCRGLSLARLLSAAERKERRLEGRERERDRKCRAPVRVFKRETKVKASVFLFRLHFLFARFSTSTSTTTSSSSCSLSSPSYKEPVPTVNADAERPLRANSIKDVGLEGKKEKRGQKRKERERTRTKKGKKNSRSDAFHLLLPALSLLSSTLPLLSMGRGGHVLSRLRGKKVVLEGKQESEGKERKNIEKHERSTSLMASIDRASLSTDLFFDFSHPSTSSTKTAPRQRLLPSKGLLTAARRRGRRKSKRIRC